MTIFLRRILVVLQLSMVALAAPVVSPSHHRVLRGQKKDKQSRAIKKEALAPKKTKPSLESKKSDRSDKQSSTTKTNRQYQSDNNKKEVDYNYFVEACQEELVADVINGGVIQHSQYVNFIYGYCDNSQNQGPQCNKEKESLGFDGLSNDMKLMYIKSFCPEDVDGQVSCLHGINDRGRNYEFAEEIVNLCKDLETLMVKNYLLEQSGNLPTDGSSVSSFKPQSVPEVNLEGSLSGGSPVYSQVGSLQTGSTITGQTQDQSVPTPKPTPRPTNRPTPTPTDDQVTQQQYNTGGQEQMQPPPWERENNTPGNDGILQDDNSAERGTVAPFPTPSPKPTYPRPDLVVQDAHGNPIINSKNRSDEQGLSGGSKAAIVLIVLLGIVIAFTSFLLVQKKRRLRDSHNPNVRRNFFFMKMRKIIPMDNGTVLEDTATYDKTYIEDDEEQNDSLGSNGEIEFNGPLFESWPNVSSCEHGEDGDLLQPTGRRSKVLSRTIDDSVVLLDASELEEQSDTEDEPSTFASSILSSFFSRTNWRGFYEGGENDACSTHKAVDEIKRAIDNAQWQEVYYLASKMAAEGNIDSNENLQSALVTSHEDKTGGQSPTREKLKPEDAARASQLDVSIAAGDWITLAARAAVFAALDSANNPVPASITVVNKESIDECLAKAKAALEEATREQARKETQNSPGEVHSTAGEEVDRGSSSCGNEFDYPKEDYSDFSKTSDCGGSCATAETSKASPETMDQEEAPRVFRSESQTTMLEKAGSSDDEDGSNYYSSPAPSHLPGPPSIAMSNQSTIPTEQSDAVSVQFFEESYRGPLRRDFENGISYPMEQEEVEIPPQDTWGEAP